MHVHSQNINYFIPAQIILTFLIAVLNCIILVN